MPSITSLAASGSTHTLYSATPLGVLPATSIAPAIETTAGTRDARPGSVRSASATLVNGPSVINVASPSSVSSSSCVAPRGSRHAIHLGRSSIDRSSTAARHSSGNALLPCSGVSRPHATGVSWLPPERQQPQRVLHAGIAVRLAGPRDRDGVDRHVVALQQVEQGHDVVEGQIRVEHDVANGGAGRGRRRRAFGPVRHAGAREHGEHDRHRCHPSHGSSVGSHRAASHPWWHHSSWWCPHPRYPSDDPSDAPATSDHTAFAPE